MDMVGVRVQALHQPIEWQKWFLQMCRYVLTDRNKAVLFPWEDSMVPLEEPQIINLFLHTPCYWAPNVTI